MGACLDASAFSILVQQRPLVMVHLNLEMPSIGINLFELLNQKGLSRLAVGILL